VHAFLDDLFDLLFPSLCAGCAAPGRALCERCGTVLAGRPFHAGIRRYDLVACWAGGEYDGALRAAILAYKERRQHGPAPPLGALLARTVEAAVLGLVGVVELVPVPSAPAVARARGGDHLRRVAGHAARGLQRRGVPARLAPVLITRGCRQDSVGLTAAARQANVAGAFEVRESVRVPGRGALRVLVDDLVTTGATLAEASRALAAAGQPPHRAAVLAATPFRSARPAGLSGHSAATAGRHEPG
jgi:predicted amidophosphoribosyltransferase